MYNEYYQSEVDEIVEEAVEKIKAKIHDDVEAYREEYKNRLEYANKNYNSARTRCNQLEEELKSKNEVIDKLQRALQKEDLTSQFPFSMGEEVYVVNEKRTVETLTCPECGGTRNISRVIEGVVYSASCPKCSYSVKDAVRCSSSCDVKKHIVEKVVVVGVTAEISESKVSYMYYYKNHNGSKYGCGTDVMFKNKKEAEEYATIQDHVSRATAFYRTGQDVPEILQQYLPKNIERLPKWS